MGFADRDYARAPQGGGGGFGSGGPGGPGGFGGGRGSMFGGGSLPTITKWLLIINAAVFVIDGLLGRFAGTVLVDLTVINGQMIKTEMNPLAAWGFFSADTGILQGQVWRFVTMQFLHDGVWHVLMNMMAVFFFGPLVERYLGSKRFLAFYLLSGAAAPVCYLLLWGIGLLAGATWIPMLGASAGVFGILVAAAKIAPRTQVLVMFVIPMQLRVLVWIWLGIEVYNVLALGHTSANNVGGSAGHLGGAAVGFLLIKKPRLLDWVDSVLDWGKYQVKRQVKQKQQRREQSLEDQVDQILDKVRQKGLHSLTEREKQILNRSTDEKRGR